MAYPPTTGAPLNLYIPAFNYGENPGDSTTWDVVANDNFTAINAFAATVVLYDPNGSQTITQPAGSYLNINSLQAYGTLPVIRYGVAANVWDTSLSRPSAGIISVDGSTPGDSLGTLKATFVDALSGFQVNGAAPNNHLLVGNGTNYVDSATIPTGAANYQIIEQAGTPLTQRNKLNFLAPLTAVDDSGDASSDIGLANSGVTAGTYANPTVTVDALGRVTSATAGAAVVATPTDVTGSRAWATVYQNTGLNPIYVSGYGSSTGGATNNIAAVIGSSSTPTLSVFSQTNGATTAGGESPFAFIVPSLWYYSVNKTNDVTASPTKWVETVLS